MRPKFENHSVKFNRKSLAPLLAAVLLSCGLLAPRAQADPIQGHIDFGGTVTFDTMSLATATQVDLWNNSFVLQRTLNFRRTTRQGDPVSMTEPWIFTPSTPLPNLWTVGGFTFDLTSSVVLSQTPQFLNVRSTGILSGNGFDPTPAVWTFTASRGDGANADTFAFQSTTSAVPEASTIAFLGIGALAFGLGMVRRRRAHVEQSR